MPKLFSRREVWLPTAWGLALLAFIVAVGGGWLVGRAHDFFAIDQPVRGPVLVVEGWIGPADLDQALVEVRQGGYQRVITSGGPIPGFSDFADYAQRAAAYLRARGLTELPVDAVPTPATRQDRSYASAVWVRDWAAKQGIPMERFDVLTSDIHARRTRLIYRMAFGPDAEVGVLATEPTEVDTRRWWTSSTAFKGQIGEALSLAYTHCCFWPAPRGTHEERWAVPPRGGARP